MGFKKGFRIIQWPTLQLQYPGLFNYPPRPGAPSYSRWGYRVYPQKDGTLQVYKIKGGITDATRAEKVGYIRYTVNKKIEDKGDNWLVQFEPVKKEYYTPFDLLQSDYVVDSFEIDELNKVLANTLFTYTHEVNSSFEPNELIKSLLRSGANVQKADKDESMDRASASGYIPLQGERTSFNNDAKVDFSVSVLPTKLGSKSTYKLKVPFLVNEQLHFDLNKAISNINNELNSIAGN